MAFTPINRADDDDPDQAKRMMEAMGGPAIVDHSIRQAIQHCWMLMPADRKNAAAVSAEIRRMVDRALRDLEEDSRAFS